MSTPQDGRDLDRERRKLAIVEEALFFPRADREGIIVQRCGGDVELLAEVRDLLRAAEGTRSFPVSESPAGVPASDAGGPDPPMPAALGRYRVERLLGEGAFGRVYLARDDELQRPVAIKVPHRHRLSAPDATRTYLDEARVVASLEHAHIATVHDYGTTGDGLCFVVSKFIDGSDLGRWAESTRPGFAEVARVLAAVAEALHHAHLQGLVHCDIKPANILIDRSGKPYVVDFGLALRVDDFAAEHGAAGTPAYMSPEQVRQEGHRIDGRSDIFSLGVVLYELLTGRLPFAAESFYGLFRQIASAEPRPPRQIRSAVPRELERMCLKALSKRAADRYTTAADLAEDLQHWIEEPEEAATAVPSAAAQASAQEPRVAIVPKGLRSFDAGDKDFFLELLPGPRDREGLPESIRFWKRRIEETDADATFRAGVLFGPSGCGKSSLLKAGLLPRLAPSVHAVYVEAAPAGTEARLLRALRKRFPALAEAPSLPEAIACLRRGQGLGSGEKVLIAVDQFEQWLHARRADGDAELVQALRQCDGGRVQALVLVRDDFWLALCRFFQALEVDMVPGENTALVDLFDSHHARKVLADFGRAFGRLNAGGLGREDEAFLAQAVSGLAEDGRVVPVRLALFAEMMKGRPWTEAALREAGGAEGVGVAFLEESFSARSASLRCRLHQKGARAVLKALLPEAGTDIRGGMCSRGDLLAASGYAERPGDFEELLRILDGELRLLTPADPEGSIEEAGAPGPAAAGQQYQLTHDYLVPSLREWLERKQRETSRGRAELKLAEHAALWSARPESRFLPAWWEYLGIRFLTRRQSWTESQLKLMRKAGRFHGLRGTALGVLLAALTWLGLTIREQVIETGRASHAAALVARLVDATEAKVPAVVEDLADYRRWADPLLKERRASARAGSREELHTALALLPADPGQVPFLLDALLAASPERFAVVRDALRPHASEVAARLWAVLDGPRKAGDEEARFRAACALASYDPGGAGWETLAEEAAGSLVSQNALVVSAWAEALRPVRRKLLGPLAAVFRDSARPETVRAVAVDVLADYGADDPVVLADLLLDADPKNFQPLFAKLEAHGERAAPPLEAEIERELRPTWSDPALDPAWTKPDPATIARIEAAQGLVAERFALCQTMVLADFTAVVEALRGTGFRLHRLRPYVAAGAVQVAAVWLRDGREFQWATGLALEDLQNRDEELRAQGFGPEDVAGCVHEGKDLYAALWLKSPSGAATSRLEVGLREEPADTEGSVQSVHSHFTGSDGEDRHCAVWIAKEGQAPAETFSFSGFEPEYSGEMYPGELQVDVQVRKAPPRLRARERFQRQLDEVQADLKETPIDPELRFDRSVAALYLGDAKSAVEDLSWVILNGIQDTRHFYFRAIAHARLGNAEAATADAASLRSLGPHDPAVIFYLDAVVSSLLGREDGWKTLEEELGKDPRDGELLFHASRAYALASGAVLPKDPSQARLHADRAVDLLERAVEVGSGRYSEIDEDPDLEALRGHPGFQALWRSAKPDRRYAALWLSSKSLASSELHGLQPAAHLPQSRDFAARGWRPASLSAAEVEPGVTATASVWHLPVVPDSQKDALAKRKASAAAALLRLRRPEKAWPLFRHSPDPSARSYLIHQVKALGVKPEALIARLTEETEVSSRRALLLGLGEFPAIEVAVEAREKLVPQLVALFRDDPDPGLHAAAEWLLRQWGEADKLAEIQRALATGKVEGERRWFLSKQGQTFVVVEGPVEFLMGSPGFEAKRELDEFLHQRRIVRSFAIAAKEVTVAEFKRFQPGFSHSQLDGAPAPDCPILGVKWYVAAAYCNWLSRQEGLPESEWSYLPNAAGEFASGMKLAPRYLARRGYRLPTEAEWEYAARAGALTSQPYGFSEDLLGKHAWYLENSSNRSWPAGSLKPNDLGLFDSLGNVWEWCQDRYRIYRVGVAGMPVDDLEDWTDLVTDSSRLLRGGAFTNGPSVVRSAYRDADLPTVRYGAVGLRPARTYP